MADKDFCFSLITFLVSKKYFGDVSVFGPVFELGFSELTIFILAFGPKSSYWCSNLLIFKLVFV